MAISGQPVTLTATVASNYPLTPAATIAGLEGPVQLAFDSSGNLFVSNDSSNTVTEFSADSLAAGGNIAPIATLTGLNGPGVLAFDASGDLYVANGGDDGGTTVSEFSTDSLAAGGTIAPVATLTGLINPSAIAFDSRGNVYVANGIHGGGASVVSEFSAASLTREETTSRQLPASTRDTGAPGHGLRPQRNLWVGNFYAGTVSEFAAGSLTGGGQVTPVATPITIPGSPNWPAGMAFDSDGNLYVVSGERVSEFAAKSLTTGGSISPATTLVGLNDSGCLTFDPSGNLFVNNFFANTVSAFAANSLTGGGSVSPIATLGALDNPDGLAVDTTPGDLYGDLFVANSGNGFGTTVSEFSAASLLVPAPTGTVDFSAVNTATNQTTDLGSETLTSVADDSNATATLAVPSGTLPAGTYVVTATYEGESNVFAGSNTELAVGATTVAVSPRRRFPVGTSQSHSRPPSWTLPAAARPQRRPEPSIFSTLRRKRTWAMRRWSTVSRRFPSLD